MVDLSFLVFTGGKLLMDFASLNKPTLMNELICFDSQSIPYQRTYLLFPLIYNTIYICIIIHENLIIHDSNIYKLGNLP